MTNISLASPELFRLVHFDLKGAPPKISFLKQLFHVITSAGANGVILEYEDMFPYNGESLESIALPYAYGAHEIHDLLQVALDNNLTVIPLVQTIGHMEFVLKHKKFAHLREITRYPNTLCPSRPESISLVFEMISQILNLHQNAPVLHLGADEVWHLGVCETCSLYMKRNNWTKVDLFLSYITLLARKIKSEYPRITLVMWDDMLRSSQPHDINKFELGQLVEPMVWHYLTIDEFKIGPEVWEKYSNIFKQVWVASAYKGASDIAQMVTPTRYHIANQQAWIQTLNTETNIFFKRGNYLRGIALTGWQRYDHFTVLCELLPLAIPSLVACLFTILEGSFNADTHLKVSNFLGFMEPIALDAYPRPTPLPSKMPRFPGANVFIHVNCLANLLSEYHQLLQHPSFKGAFSKYQIQRGWTNPLHIDQFLPKAKCLLSNLEGLNMQLRNAMDEYYYSDTITEWLEVNLAPHLKQLAKIVKNGEEQLVIHESRINMPF